MYDVAVVGLGAFGAHALWQLAVRGLKVIGLEQHGRTSPFGSSHGHTRLFREACMEHEQLGQVASRSAELWRELETSTNSRLLTQDGTISIGHPDSDYISGAKAAAEFNAVSIKTYNSDELATLFPAFENVDADEVGIFDSSGGTVAAEASVGAALDSAEFHGAEVVCHTRVKQAKRLASCVELTFASGQTIRTKKLLLAIGPWLAQVAQHQGFEALHTAMSWWGIDPSKSIRAVDLYQAPHLNGFIRRFDDMSIWGHGNVDGRGIKIGLSLNSKSHEVVDPDSHERDVVPARDWLKVHEVASRTFPALSQTPLATRPCMITTSPDGQFVIGELTADRDIYVAGGCHGHGFKHSAAIGEYIAERIAGEPPTLNTGIWSPDRFDGLGTSILTSLFSESMATSHG